MKIYKIILVIGIINLTLSYNMLKRFFRLGTNIAKNHSNIKNAFQYSTNQFIPITSKSLYLNYNDEETYYNAIDKYNKRIKEMKSSQEQLDSLQSALNNKDFSSHDEKFNLEERIDDKLNEINNNKEKLNNIKKTIQEIEQSQKITPINYRINQSVLSQDIYRFNSMLREYNKSNLTEPVIKIIKELKKDDPWYHIIEFLQTLKSKSEFGINSTNRYKIRAWANWFEKNPESLPLEQNILIMAEQIKQKEINYAKAYSLKLFDAVDKLKYFLNDYKDYYYQHSNSIKIDKNKLKKIYNLIAINEKIILHEKLDINEKLNWDNYSRIIFFLEHLANIENSVVFEYSWNEHLRDEIDAFADFFEKSKNNELPTYKDISQYYERNKIKKILRPNHSDRFV